MRYCIIFHGELNFSLFKRNQLQRVLNRRIKIVVH